MYGPEQAREHFLKLFNDFRDSRAMTGKELKSYIEGFRFENYKEFAELTGYTENQIKKMTTDRMKVDKLLSYLLRYAYSNKPNKEVQNE